MSFGAEVMGCLCNKAGKGGSENDAEAVQIKEYTWDKRDKIDIKDYTIENVCGGEIWRLPTSVNGEQFIIQNCNNANIYIFDHINTITIDDCTNCKIILGPVKGSVFLRDCKSCVCVVACGQFRTRDCRKMDIFLCCATQPIIEASTGMHFGCYQMNYKDLADHFSLASLSVFNNNWSNIHDFTPVEGENNWCLLPHSIHIEDYVSLPTAEEPKSVNMCLSATETLVPYTWGPHKMPDSESCLVTFFSNARQQQTATAFITTLKMQQPNCLLLRTKEVQMQLVDGEQVFNSSSYNALLQKGPVVGLHYNGPDCMRVCQAVAEEMSKTSGTKDRIFVRTRPESAHQQVQSFFNFANMESVG